jgi:hypothetical protein
MYDSVVNQTHEGSMMQATKVRPTRRVSHITHWLALGMALLVLIPLYLFSLDLQRERGYRFDIYPRYVGTQAVWAGESPYSQVVTERIQLRMYGRLQPPDADQQRFAHPAYSAIFLAPLLLLTPEVAIPVWISIQFVALIVTPFLWLSILRWKPSPLTTVLLLIGLIFVFRYPILSYLWGQFTGGIVFLFSLAIWLLARRRDAWAGAALALATVPPSVSGPLAIVLLGSLLLIGRWRGMASFVAVLGAAMLISIVRIGWWIPDFLEGLRAYSIYAHPVSAADFLPPFLRLPFMIAVALALLWSGWRVVRSEHRRGSMHQTHDHGVVTGLARQTPTDTWLVYLCVACLACLLLLPQTGNYYLVLGIPILTICAWKVSRLHRDTGRTRHTLSLLLVAVTIFSPWLWVAVAMPDVETLVTPLLLAITLAVAMRLGGDDPPPYARS